MKIRMLAAASSTPSEKREAAEKLLMICNKTIMDGLACYMHMVKQASMSANCKANASRLRLQQDRRLRTGRPRPGLRWTSNGTRS